MRSVYAIDESWSRAPAVARMTDAIRSSSTASSDETNTISMSVCLKRAGAARGDVPDLSLAAHHRGERLFPRGKRPPVDFHVRRELQRPVDDGDVGADHPDRCERIVQRAAAVAAALREGIREGVGERVASFEHPAAHRQLAMIPVRIERGRRFLDVSALPGFGKPGPRLGDGRLFLTALTFCAHTRIPRVYRMATPLSRLVPDSG